MPEKVEASKRGGPMAADHSAVLSVRVPDVVFDAADALAKQDGVKLSELVRALLVREVRQRLRHWPM